MKIIELTAENVKRLKAVQIRPDGHVQVVGGRNAQGKTSVLDAIWLALGGGQASKGTKRPVRDGESGARVQLNLDDELLVTRSWTADGKSTLQVESGDGAQYRSPQGMLDALVGRLSFDPLEFTRLSAREQQAALLDLVDLDVDLDALAAERAEMYESRTVIGRDGKRLDGQLAGLGPVEEAPKSEESAAALIAEMRAAEALIQRQENDLDRRLRLTEAIVQLEEQLADLRSEREKVNERINLHEPAPDVRAIEERLDQVEQTNTAVRRNAERARVTKDLKDHRDAYAQLNDDIAALDQRKADALAAATFPVDGLGFGFDDASVTYNGIPFSQASAAEQIRVSLAMAMSLNPKLRVIRILDGSLLDADNLALIEGMAKDNDYQVWIERVGDGDASAVVIEDGEVAA